MKAKKIYYSIVVGLQSLFILFDIIIMDLIKELEMTKAKMEANHRNLE